MRPGILAYPTDRGLPDQLPAKLTRPGLKSTWRAASRRASRAPQRAQLPERPDRNRLRHRRPVSHSIAVSTLCTDASTVTTVVHATTPQPSTLETTSVVRSHADGVGGPAADTHFAGRDHGWIRSGSWCTAAATGCRIRPSAGSGYSASRGAAAAKRRLLRIAHALPVRGRRPAGAARGHPRSVRKAPVGQLPSVGPNSRWRRTPRRGRRPPCGPASSRRRCWWRGRSSRVRREAWTRSRWTGRSSSCP